MPRPPTITQHETSEWHESWSPRSPHVKAALKFLRSRGGVVRTEELLDWDLMNGQHLFMWDDDIAATEWRLTQARLFINSFKVKFDGYKVRAFRSVKKNVQAGIPERGYLPVEKIVASRTLREEVIASIEARIINLAAELKMWQLTDKETQRLLKLIRQAISGE